MRELIRLIAWGIAFIVVCYSAITLEMEAEMQNAQSYDIRDHRISNITGVPVYDYQCLPCHKKEAK